MVDRVKKEALAKVFGVQRRDGMLTGVPFVVPGLMKKITCTTCNVKTVKGLPVQFEQYMTDEQKTEFMALTKYKRPAKSSKKE